jgi:hypothetical protein
MIEEVTEHPGSGSNQTLTILSLPLPCQNDPIPVTLIAHLMGAWRIFLKVIHVRRINLIRSRNPNAKDT